MHEGSSERACWANCSAASNRPLLWASAAAERRRSRWSLAGYTSAQWLVKLRLSVRFRVSSFSRNCHPEARLVRRSDSEGGRAKDLAANGQCLRLVATSAAKSFLATLVRTTSSTRGEAWDALRRPTIRSRAFLSVGVCARPGGVGTVPATWRVRVVAGLDRHPVLWRIAGATLNGNRCQDRDHDHQERFRTHISLGSRKRSGRSHRSRRTEDGSWPAGRRLRKRSPNPG